MVKGLFQTYQILYDILMGTMYCPVAFVPYQKFNFLPTLTLNEAISFYAA